MMERRRGGGASWRALGDRAAACWRTVGLALLVVLASAAVPPHTPAAAQTAPPQAPTVFFPETGQAVSGTFWDTWSKGGPDLFGFPLTAAYEEDGVTVQWFQRARFEAWPQRGVMLALLGEEAGVSEPPLPPPADERAQLAAGRRYFPQTGHLVGGEILAFLERNGGPERLGFPLTEEVGTGTGGVVQWFQRARLEWRPGAGVSLGLVGAELLERTGVAARPVAAPRARPAGATDWYPVMAARAEEQARLARAVARTGFDVVLEPGEKWVDVDIAGQRVTAYEGDRAVFTDLVSTGRAGKGLTPRGTFRINRRVANETMDSRTIGIMPGNPLYYRLENVLYTQYFDNAGTALHYAWWHNNFGQPMSFGCVNLRLATAKFFWDWAGVGTRVVVH